MKRKFKLYSRRTKRAPDSGCAARAHARFVRSCAIMGRPHPALRATLPIFFENGEGEPAAAAAPFVPSGYATRGVLRDAKTRAEQEHGRLNLALKNPHQQEQYTSV